MKNCTNQDLNDIFDLLLNGKASDLAFPMQYPDAFKAGTKIIFIESLASINTGTIAKVFSDGSATVNASYREKPVAALLAMSAIIH